MAEVSTGYEVFHNIAEHACTLISRHVISFHMCYITDTHHITYIKSRSGYERSISLIRKAAAQLRMLWVSRRHSMQEKALYHTSVDSLWKTNTHAETNHSPEKRKPAHPVFTTIYPPFIHNHQTMGETSSLSAAYQAQSDCWNQKSTDRTRRRRKRGLDK